MSKNKLVPELHITDFSASLHFYTQVLGFKISYQRADEGFAFLEREGAELMLDTLGQGRNFVAGEMEYPYGRGLNLQIEVSNVDALYKNAVTAKAKIFLDMEEKWYRKEAVELGNKQFIVQDPDGYLLRFFEDLGSREL